MGRRITIRDGGKLDYDGSQIEPLWAFRELGVQGDSVVYFVGGMKIKRERLIDIEDLREQSDEIPISSDEALHFIVEHFDDPSLRLAYHRQRILVSVAKEKVVEGCSVHIKRKASDLYADGKKLSVSVATASPSSSKIHLGLNTTSTGAPPNIRITGLSDLGIANVKGLGQEIAEGYVHEINGIEEAISKTRVF